MIILAIETSCDETAISIVNAEGSIDSPSFTLLGSAINSQVKLHEKYGGVYPNLARREHAKNIIPILKVALEEAGMLHKSELWDVNYELRKEKENTENLNNKIDSEKKENIIKILEKEKGLSDEFLEFIHTFGKPKIDKIVVTVGPGLEPALWVGISFAKALGEAWDTEVLPANHMEGHIASVLLKANTKIKFPVLALLISGGHTELILLESWKNKKKIGETRDDAVGEAYDKVARMLGLPYPGGPQISKLAEIAREQNIKSSHPLPRPMIHSSDYDFSFSGLKTAVLYYLRDLNTKESYPEKIFSSVHKFLARNLLSSRSVESRKPLDNIFSGSFLGNITGAKFRSSAERGQGNFQQKISVLSEDSISNEIKIEISREFEDAVTEVLISKTSKAIDKFNPQTLVIGGGVIANTHIRKEFLKLKEKNPELNILIPDLSLSTDNATMIAMAGFIEYLSKSLCEVKLEARGNLDL